MIRSLFLWLVILVWAAIFFTPALILAFVDRSGNSSIFLIKLWGKVTLWTTRVKVKVKGREYLTTTSPKIFMSNHQSNFDVMAWASVAPPNIKGLMKKEIMKIPVFGLALRVSGHISIDRQNQEKAFRSIDKAAERIRKGVCVFMAPEGTRSPDGTIKHFKKGGFIMAIKAGVPIVPMTIRGAHEVEPKHSLLIKPGTIRLTIGQPIETINYTVEERDKLIKVVRDTIVKNFEDDDWWKE